ncbi:unnamed protein product [Lepeophtheirus salmonis]|uniref:(salmon louse) hypothetical protein n=1 Tax=Lepeophtheirus salmonis TaxID=72036 RepID=A0A7R8CFE1_LEPSM|nr:unnamed protein product [Lepeophtheirus salmonis]CAF2805573.1 unnamed protein product [Lepeophtheirus salmonis]
METFHRTLLLLRKDPLSESNKLNLEKGLKTINPSSFVSTQGKNHFMQFGMDSTDPFLFYVSYSSNLFGLCLKFLSEIHSLRALRLIEHLVLGWRLGDSDVARLERLVQYLMKFIVDCDNKEMRASSVFIIVCLCHWNTCAADFILSQKEIEYLFNSKQTDLKLQALIKMLNYFMSQSRITDESLSEDPNEMNKIESYIVILIDAFCSAYVCDDLLMMRLLTEILESITKERKTKRTTESLDTLSLAKGIILITDFGDESNQMSNEYILGFLRHLLKISSDNKGAFDIISLLASQRLKSNLRSPILETMLCIQDGISLLGDDAEIIAKSNEGYMMDYIISQSLQTLLSNKINHMDRLSVLETLRSISKVDFNLSEMIVSRLQCPIQEEKYEDCIPELTQLEMYRPLTSVVEDKIDSSIHFIRRTIENKNFENVSSADLFEFGNFQKYSADRKAEKIQQYLNAAEETIAKKKKYVVQLESKVNGNELQSVQSNNLSLKNEMKSALHEKMRENGELEENYEKLSLKALKYKEDIDALQKTIQEHFQVQEELQHSLKTEKKLNSDIVASLEKREDKMKKKDRLIEEEVSFETTM